MKLGPTAIFLLATVIVVPVLAWLYADPLSALQQQILQVLLAEFVFFALLSFIVAELTRNYSQTDKLWSITPVVFAWTATVMADFDPRMLLVTGLITLWGVRLTYNFGRMGGYSWKFWEGSQDYRWDYVRKTTPVLQSDWAWCAFNFFFIAGYQHGLLLLISLPLVLMASADAAPLGVRDLLLVVLHLGLLALETVADRQQWDFQSEKYRRINAGEDLPEPYSKGFNTVGLWGRSRHPNYFAEQGMWVVVFLFSVAAVGLNWSIMGCLLLILLFRNSSELAETISSEKYPAYAEYRRQVPRFFPKLTG